MLKLPDLLIESLGRIKPESLLIIVERTQVAGLYVDTVSHLEELSGSGLLHPNQSLISTCVGYLLHVLDTFVYLS